MTSAPSRLSVTNNERMITLAGDLDSHTAPLLDEALSELGADDDVSLELSNLAFVDSSGLRVIIEAHGRHAEKSTSLTLVSPSSAVSRIIEITGLAEHLTITA